MNRSRAARFLGAGAAIAAAWMAAASASAKIEPALPPGPKIEFGNTTYDFGRATVDQPLRFDFVFTNAGSSPLVLSNRTFSCNCAAAVETWIVREVPPGQTGSIPIELNTGSFPGPFAKNVVLISNDKAAPSIPLQIRGTVWQPLEISPAYALLQSTTDTPIPSAAVSIRNHSDQPLYLSAPEYNPSILKAELVTNRPGQEYRLILSPVPPLPRQNVQERVTFKTSLTNAPILSVRAVIHVPPEIDPPQPQPRQAPGAALEPARPRIEFASTRFDFGRAAESDIRLKHAFVFTNTGSGMLVVSNITTTCGCTTASDWTREVPPNGTGLIPVEISTADLEGRISKTVTVISNDKAHPEVVLDIVGNVWKAIDVAPKMAILRLTPGSTNLASSVSILNETGQPLVLSPPEFNPRAVQADLKTLRPGKEFKLVLSAIPPLRLGTLQEWVSIKTSFAEVPSLAVRVLILVLPPVSASPDELRIPREPLPEERKQAFILINNTEQPLTLANASLTPNVVRWAGIEELEPGRQMRVNVSFPKGFQAAPDQILELRVDTNSPGSPVLRLPIRPLR